MAPPPALWHHEAHFPPARAFSKHRHRGIGVAAGLQGWHGRCGAGDAAEVDAAAPSDPPPTAQGQSEAAILARGMQRQYLASVMELGDGPEVEGKDLGYRVISSPMRLALQPALPLADALGVNTVVAEAGLSEVDGYHSGPGKPPAPSSATLAGNTAAR